MPNLSSLNKGCSIKRSFLLLFVFLAVTELPVFGQQFKDIEQHRTCKYCNMDRRQYAHSRMLIVYSDGTEFGSCSLHCVAVDLALHIDKTPRAILTADYNTRELIDAENAYWVIGGNLPGVMTKRAKWAFEKKQDAEDFVLKNGGTIATFDQAMKASYEDMHTDSKMIRNKRKLRKMQSQP